VILLRFPGFHDAPFARAYHPETAEPGFPIENLGKPTSSRCRPAAGNRWSGPVNSNPAASRTPALPARCANSSSRKYCWLWRRAQLGTMGSCSN